MIWKKKTRTKGFTLIEMMVSVTLFIFVMLSVTTLFLSVVTANKKAQTQKFIFDNVYSSMEIFIRHIRSGTAYACIPSGTSCTTFSFTDVSGNQVIYRLNAGVLQRSLDNGISYDPMTGSNVTITTLRFYLFGDGITTQPRVLVTIAGTAGKGSTLSSFAIQSTLSQALSSEI